mmetsp:Transcript_39618/g.29255  ORF Transcript_39618/g.29255 Transcript_39618/m.29255 type:complete len:161 (-) Transcript_39618:261-743(-)|eukprot:CAMPEP_0202978834 /NCGR_PEP_ID=MMETSP1396-20130829/85155_1 /ASSEMBLY_ACC=CAM_ASM_000872 /TAXON_ID= /ORGANISM="Pseudokeronopsis sp., Strain Brazil" /LENGTH=160 /DNA_ID=CAMNT_0049717993 /DNA_START=3268 /DNA_END=3750 /DNA_ORIENTATION=-
MSSLENTEQRVKVSLLPNDLRQEIKKSLLEFQSQSTPMIINSLKSSQMLEGYNFDKTTMLQNRNKSLNSLFQSDSQEYFTHLVELNCECPQILVVDDIDINRYVIVEVLRSKFGIPVAEANNGKECLQIIKRKSLSECCSSFKVIFMDFSMPVMNGLEAT